MGQKRPFGTCALLGATLCGFGCRHEPGHESGAPGGASAGSATLPAGSLAPSPVETSALTARLAQDAVSHDSPARRTLYTWTTAPQLVELAKNRRLLTRTESPKCGDSFFTQLLDRRARDGSKLAGLLRTAPFARLRFAWPAPWATLLGPGGESYGDELIQVTLKAEAWIVIFRASGDQLAAIDLAGQPVAAATVAEHPERVAAVYFVCDGQTAPGRASYREYVLCNEHMIESFSLNTPEIASKLAASAGVVADLAEFLTRGGAPPLAADWSLKVPEVAWNRVGKPATPIEAYESALAFAVDGYAPLSERLVSLSNKLRGVSVSGAPLVHAPAVPFQQLGAEPAKPLRVPPRSRKPYETY